MAILDSLLTAIMRADGDALVLHVGERPYVVTGIGNVDLAKTVLTIEAVSSMLAQLVPGHMLAALSEVGAVEHQLQPPSPMRDAFTVVAARGGDDIWIEIRRKRAMVRPVAVAAAPVAKVLESPPAQQLTRPHEGPVAETVPVDQTAREPRLPEEEAEPFAAAATAQTSVHEASPPQVAEAPEMQAAPPHVPDVEPREAPNVPLPEEPEPLTAPEVLAADAEVHELGGRQTASPGIEAVGLETIYIPEPTEAEPVDQGEPVYELELVTELESVLELDRAEQSKPALEDDSGDESEQVYELELINEPEAIMNEPGSTQEPEPVKEPEAVGAREVAEVKNVPEAPGASEPLAELAALELTRPAEPSKPVEGGNVVPLTRVIRVEPPRSAPAKENIVQRLLAAAAARSAEQIYLTSQSRPFLRVEGEMRPLENEPIFTSGDVDAIVHELMPESARESHGRGEPSEWTSEFDGVGRIRCATFRDHRGPGVVFHLATTRPLSAEQLGLTRDIQALATEPEGLVVVAGPRGGGKSTLIGAMVDLINRQHSVSVIAIERQIRIVHENRLAFVSQREVRGTGGTDAMAIARAALRENPDVLVLEDLKSPEIVQFALDAAGTGRLVVLSVTAGSTVSALTRILESFPPSSRKAAQAALAERLRGAVSQVVLRKTGGGRIAARELLLPTASVTNQIAEGQLTQLATAVGSGRKPGMVSLNDVLLTLVKNGSVDASEAYRKADNRQALLAMLEHDGVDTSLLARLA